MILTYLKTYTDELLNAYAKEYFGRDIKDSEKDIFYLYNEFYVNKEINKAKDQISEIVRKYMLKVKNNEDIKF